VCLAHYLFLSRFSYGIAWATFAYYGSMMVMSYMGAKEYRIPYAWKN
jgi:hypothetical protein